MLIYTIPASPKYSDAQQTDLSAMGGGVGVTFDAGFVYSAYGGPTYGPVVDFATSAPKVEGDSFDACGGHSSSATEASYHYHVPPVCLLHQLGAAEGAPSPQVGWMLDGFPIYGPLGPGGTKMKTCTVTGGTVGVDICTDDCGGYYGDTGDGYLYRYYFLGEYNDGTCCTTPIDPPFGGGEDYFPFTPICLKGCCPQNAHCTLSDLPTCNDDAADGTTSSFTATAVAALEVNTGTCAADDMCCDSTLNERCRPGPPCGECAYEFAGVPAPVAVTVAVSIVLGGVTCSAFGAAEEAAFIAAVLGTMPGLLEDDIGPLTCAAASASRRRRPLDDAAPGVSIAFDVTVTDAEWSERTGASIETAADLAGAITATLGAAVSSGTFTSELQAAAADAGSAALLSAVATGVEVGTLEPTPAPTRAPSTPAPSTDDDRSRKPSIDRKVLLTFFGIFALALVCCCIGLACLQSGKKKETHAQLELTSTQAVRRDVV